MQSICLCMSFFLFKFESHLYYKPVDEKRGTAYSSRPGMNASLI